MTGAAASPAARVALTLIIGALGGAIFAYAGLPAAWLAGSMIAVTAAVMLGYPAAIYDPARIAVFIILGIQIGGSIDQEMLRRMASWPASVIILALTVIAVTWSGYEFFRRAYAWDRATSLFSSVPGALSLTLLLADDARADMPRVTIVQCIRLFFLVAVLPGIISTMDGVSTQTVIASRPSGEFQDAAILVAAGAAGGFIAERLKIPAGLIMGALAASAAVKTAGFVSGPLTNLLLFPAYVGAMQIARYAGISVLLPIAAKWLERAWGR